jgi:riboflavin kinase / FMN adenylyltransferase
LTEFFSSLEEVTLPGAWLTIGSFDGVHLGHQALISRLVWDAHAARAPAVVVTFYPHPVVVLREIHTPFYLTGPKERADLLADLGIDAVVTLRFDRQMSQLTAEEFMKRLDARMVLRQLYVGFNFALGRDRQGDVSHLREIGQKWGFNVQVIAPIDVEGGPISSSQIRTWLNEGEIEKVTKGLGRVYTMEGEVVRGDGRGRQIGIPTANLDILPERLMPRVGVYAGWAYVAGRRWAAVANIGMRPTFERSAVVPRLEAHLLDTGRQPNGKLWDFYGQQMKIEFVTRLRDELRFPSPDALLVQIRKDITAAREIFFGG